LLVHVRVFPACSVDVLLAVHDRLARPAPVHPRLDVGWKDLYVGLIGIRLPVTCPSGAQRHKV
jgi:hypothetical protein